MARYFLNTILALLITFFATAAQAASISVVTEPSGLNPGDTYRLVFFTSETIDLNTTDIATYNNFVNDVANNNGSYTGSQVAGLNVSWKILGSTSSMSAAENTATRWDSSEGPVDTDHPIYNLNGDKVADDNTDLWDGSIDTAIMYSEEGKTADEYYVPDLWHQDSDGRIAAGTNPGGVIGTNGVLGDSGGASHGFSDATTSDDWIKNQNWGWDPAPVYALSDPITVVPEPTAFVLAGLALLGLAIRRRR